MQLNKSSEIHNHEVILQFESKFEDTESLEIKSWVRIPDWTPVTGVQILDSPKYRSTLLSHLLLDQNSFTMWNSHILNSLDAFVRFDPASRLQPCLGSGRLWWLTKPVSNLLVIQLESFWNLRPIERAWTLQSAIFRTPYSFALHSSTGLKFRIL